MANIMSFEEWRKSKQNSENTTTSLKSNPSFAEYKSNKEAYDELTRLNNLRREEEQRKQEEQSPVAKFNFLDTAKEMVKYANPVYTAYKTINKGIDIGKNIVDRGFKQGEGNVIQNIGGTIADTGINVTKGFLNTTEDLTDFVQYKIADVYDFLGDKTGAQKFRSNADVNATKALFGENELNTENINFKYLPEAITTGKIENEIVPEETLAQKIDKYSYFDEGMDEVGQSVGQILFMVGANKAISKTGLTSSIEGTLTKHGVSSAVAKKASGSISQSLISYSTAYGGTYSSLRKAGVDDNEAKAQARISGLVEAISEQLHDGIPGTTTAGWADKITDRFAKNRALKTILNSIGEADEEIFGNVLTTIINDAYKALDKDNQYLNENYSGNLINDLKDKAFSEEALDEYLTVALSSLVTNTGSNVGQNINKNQMIKNYAKENNIKYETAEKRLGLEINADNEITSNKSRLTESSIENIEKKIGSTLNEEGRKVVEDYVNSIKDKDINKYNEDNVFDYFNEYAKERLASLSNQQETTQETTQQATQDNNVANVETKNIETQNTNQEQNNTKVSKTNQLKQKQFDIIQNTNPMTDEYHTGIRSTKDIKTFKQAYNEAVKEATKGGYDNYSSYPDVKNESLNEAMQNNTIRVYSSKPIENGVFVSPSLRNAKDYAGDGKTYFKDVNLDDVAWINVDEGQYANVNSTTPVQEQKTEVKTNPLVKNAKTVQETKQPLVQNVKQETVENTEEERKEYKSTEKLPENVKKGTYIQPSTPIRQDTKKGKKFVQQLTKDKSINKELSKNYTSFVDKNHPMQEIADASGNKQLYPKYNNRGMSIGKGQYQLGTAQTDNEGNIIGKSVNQIFEPAEKAGLTVEFDDYLAHKLNIERYDKVPVWDENVTPEISQEIVDEYETLYPQFKEWAQDVYKYNDNQLQKMIDAGLAKENARDWLYNNYVTIAREIGPKTNPLLVNAKGISINSPIRRAKGSNLGMRPMKEAMARQTLLTERAIADNIAGQELLNVLGGTVGETRNLLTQTQELENNSLVQNPDGTYNYTVYKNGIPVTMQVTKEVADAIRPSKMQDWESLLPFKAINTVSSKVRGLLTDKNPMFIFTNFFKDLGDAPLNSKYSAGELYATYPKAVSMMIKNSPEWQKYVANGGLANTYFDTGKGEFVKSKNKFVRAIQTVNQLVEQAPRFTEYLNTLSHGGTLQEALYNSAEITTNFARGGEITKILNRNGFNFLNASVQGFDKQIRNFTQQPGAKGYVQLLSKVAIFGVLPALLNNYLLGDDDDYEELPDYVKDNYYLFKTGDNQFVRIPKGRVMSVFGTTARHLVEIGEGNETAKDLIKDTGEQIINNVAPNNPLENNIFSPLISVANNKSWSGSKIVSTTLENYPDAYQYDEKTTSLAKWLGKTFNYSPKKIDYLLDQYTGGLGDIVMPSMTPYAESNSDNVAVNALIAPFVSKFSVDSTISNKYVNQFYDVKNELQKEVKVFNSIEDSSETFEKSLQYKYLDTVGNEISALYAKKKEIQNSNLSTSQKYEQARAIQREIDDLAKFAMEDYQTGYYSDVYALIGDKEFKTTMQNGKLIWTAVDEKTKAKQEEYAEKYDMTPDDYYAMQPLTQSVIVDSNVYKFNEIDKKLKTIRNNTTEDKAETIKYINSLNMSLPQKAMYMRYYYSSYNDYNSEIFNYIKSLDIIPEQKKSILIYLGFDYDKNTGTFSWK